MSQRGKSGKKQNRNDEGTATGKRRKGRPKASATVEDENEGWTAREVKGGSIYNQRAPEAPAELFRKDLISAMKMPDNEPLASDEFYVIADQWKPEWERGVQVPVNPDSLPEPHVTVTHTKPRAHEFKLPKNKYIRITADERLRSEDVHLSSVAARAEAACHYDLDDVDIAWLTMLNGERALMGFPPVTEDQLERILEELERRCRDRIQGLVKAEEGLGIEFDENVICDVCRSPDSEDGNEMVFCDSCNICVHQACYGITTIPAGSWLCRTCALSKRPECVLCPNKGGAMKCTKFGQDWAHVSCALWIPEVSIGCVERMEPITKISNIPQSRWALACVLCRERVGACIQCSVKTCKTAYHVTCAFKNGLEMRAIIEDELADDGVKLRSYCEKHSKKRDPRPLGSDDEEGKKRKRKDMTSEEKNQARAAKLHEIEAEFYKHVSITDVTGSAVLLEVDTAAIESVYNYWKLKRRAGNNLPLLPPRNDDLDVAHRRQSQPDVDDKRLLVQLRQDLERVRNLCYMVNRREKLSRTYFRFREQTFHKQAALLSSNAQLTTQEIEAVLQANHGPNTYDRLYSHDNAPNNENDFDKILSRIQGGYNGISKVDGNPYKKSYVNGTTRRRSLFGSSSDSGGERRRATTKVGDSSSEDDRWGQKPLGRLQRAVGRSLSDDSDDLLPLPNATPISRLGGSIYSDTDSDNSLHDDRNSTLKTKGALKSFMNADRRKGRKSTSKADKENIKSSKASSRDSGGERTALTKNKTVVVERGKRKRDEEKKENYRNAPSSDELSPPISKTKSVVKTTNNKKEGKMQTDAMTTAVTTMTTATTAAALGDKDNLLISYVPQRQAAKKATETIKSGLNDVPLSPQQRKEVKKKVEEVTVKTSPKSVSSSSTSSSGSSSSSTDSSSDSDDDKTKPLPKSIFDPEPVVSTSRKEDWPFLDKEPQSNSVGDKKFKKVPDKKLKTSDGRPENEFQPPTLKREEFRARGSGDRVRSSGTKPRDLPQDATSPRCESNKRRKSIESLFAERIEKTRNDAASSSLRKSNEIDDDDDNDDRHHHHQRRKLSRTSGEPVKEPPPVECSAKSKKDELPVKRGPGRPRRLSARLESENKTSSDKPIPSEDESKPKAKPMPRSVKKALGLLDDEINCNVHNDDEKPMRVNDKRSDVSEKNFDKDKFRRSNEPLESTSKKISLKSELLSPGSDFESTDKAVQGLARSIFSPQPHNLDMFDDLDNDISTVDDTLPKDRPLGLFNFSNDLLLREDTKEDSKRETYHLVEKLRLQYAKKCGPQDVASPLAKDEFDVKIEKSDIISKATENGLGHLESTLDSQGPPPTPGCHLDHATLQGKFTPNSQDSHASMNKSTDSPASQSYQQQNTPLTPLSQNYQQQHTPQTPSSQNNYQPQTPSSQSYPQHGTPQTPSYNMQQNTPQTPYVQHGGSLTPNSYPSHNTPQTPLSQSYQAPQTPSSQPCPPIHGLSSQPYQPAAALTPQGFSSSQGGYAATTPQQGFPASSASMDSVAAGAFNGTPAFPPGTTLFNNSQQNYDGVFDSCANTVIRDSAKIIGSTADKMETGSNSDRSWQPANSNASSSVYPSPSENYARWQESQVISRRSSSASVTSGSESKEPDSKQEPPKPLLNCLPLRSHPHVPPTSITEPETFIPPYMGENSNYHHLYPDAPPFVLPFPFGPYHPLASKSSDEPPPPPPPLGMSFTSAQQNLAFAAALISAATADPEPRPMPSSVAQSKTKPVPMPLTSPVQPISVPVTPPTPTPPAPPPPTPSRSTRVSGRVASQGKSPEKSPKGKEPAPRRARGASTGRGRGRGRGRGKNTTPAYDDSALKTKLVGTVYDMDFEDEGFDDSLQNLKAMRDRRKSTDVHDKKTETVSLRVATSTPTTVTVTSNAQVFPDVAPPLPGPVDMRTYSSFESHGNNTEFPNHVLGAFNNLADAPPHVNDFDEEMEKELQSAIKSSSRSQQPAQPTPTTTPPIRPDPPETPDSAKVSLSDSRNQLKFKIKGPFRDENYSAVSVVTPSAPPPVQPTPPEQPQLTGTLRRMRKKELLRQYWTQDMNMHEGPAPAAPQVPPPSRTAITIPKAVASMTTIPTREDYRALIDANTDKKRNKGRGKDDEDEHDDSFNADGRVAVAGNASARRNKTQPVPPMPTKLKIKIGDIPQIDVEKKVLRVRPPKKRHSNVMTVMPTVDELRRESMKYRRKIMADFGDDDEEKKNHHQHERERSKTKSKKKKRKSRDEPPTGPPPKIVIRFGGSDRLTVNAEADNSQTTATSAATAAAAVVVAAANPSSEPSISDVPSDSKARTSKSSPIRLKFARSEEGSYVMAQGSDKPPECPPVPVR